MEISAQLNLQQYITNSSSSAVQTFFFVLLCCHIYSDLYSRFFFLIDKNLVAKHNQNNFGVTLFSSAINRNCSLNFNYGNITTKAGWLCDRIAERTQSSFALAGCNLVNSTTLHYSVHLIVSDGAERIVG